MEFTAVAKGVRIAPRKVRLIADAMRKQKSISKSLINLSLINKRASGPIAKTLESAIANAVNRGAKKEELILKSIEIMEGQAFKRARPSCRVSICGEQTTASKHSLEHRQIEDWQHCGVTLRF